jgi:integrase
MPRRSHDPSYRLHKQSGQAIVTLSDNCGSRRDYLLGKFGTPESRSGYRRLLTEWEASNYRLPDGSQTSSSAIDLSVNELLDAFWEHAKNYYQKLDGSYATDFKEYRICLRPVKHLYGLSMARDFGPLALKAARQLMIDGYDHPKYGWQPPLARMTINKRIGRIKRVWKWGAAEELISETPFVRLQTVEGLRLGRTKAKETSPIKPVSLTLVQDTLSYLRPQVAAMVQLQLHTGMRPGEVVIMRTLDLDTSGKIWLYRPGSDQGPNGQHKTAWRGHSRIIALGPKARAIIRPWFRLNVTDYLFQPKEAREYQDEQRKENRKTPMTPSQMARKRKSKPNRPPGERYTVASYGRAVARGCERAFAFPIPQNLSRKELKKWREENQDEIDQWRRGHRWHPNQLRHTKATEIRREAGLDAARAVLGHRTPTITEVYAELDMTKAVEVMERLG